MLLQVQRSYIAILTCQLISMAFTPLVAIQDVMSVGTHMPVTQFPTLTRKPHSGQRHSPCHVSFGVLRRGLQQVPTERPPSASGEQPIFRPRLSIGSQLRLLVDRLSRLSAQRRVRRLRHERHRARLFLKCIGK